MLKKEIAVTKMAVEGPKSIKLTKKIARFTETLPVLGSGADRASAAKANNPNSTTPRTDMSLYFIRI